ncbi:MFS transporter [Amycolatopsis sp. QT-25]|uniref:MFS transporter n=1 Tax=Amycolatopsis sp. QT-25 TaxID=3034022 RepID=UPI0023EE28E9|nr:MFS transporter [Amycolatopsis sp. QT-25]WET76271.1 MFS transporter [Amycolatopsis sp. QT-25]
MTDGKADTGRSRNLWHNTDFTKLWGGETLSQVGSQITLLVLPLIAILHLDAGAEQLGWLKAAQTAPVLVIALLAGVWLDNHRRRPLLVLTNLGRAALLGLIPLLFLADGLTLAAVLVISALIGTLTVCFDIGYVSYLPTLVERDQLVSANARLESTYSIAEIGGPGLGGLLVGLLAAPFVLLADAMTYLLAAIGISRIKRVEPQPPPRQSPSLWRDMREGVRFTFRDGHLRILAAQSAVFNCFEQAILTLYLLYGIETLGLSASLLGGLLAAGSAGALAGALFAGRIGRRTGSGGATVLAMAISSVSLFAVPAATGAPAAVITILLAGLVLHGAGLAVFNVYALSIRAEIVPSHHLSRVTGSYRLVIDGAVPLGGLLGGYLGAFAGLRAAMWLCGACLTISCVLFAFSRMRYYRGPETETRSA